MVDMKRDAKFYQRQLELADKEERKWRKSGEKIIDKYRDDEGEPNPFNILWSNTQTQLPALFAQRPKPDVRRRWGDANPVGREIATAVERALEFSMDAYNFVRMGEKLVLDFLLPGRMVARVRYHPFTQSREEVIELGADDPIPEEDDRNTIEETEEGFIHRRQYDELVHEEVRAYHVPWKHYRQSPADRWDDVWWVAYGDNFLTKDEIIEQFGEEFDDVPLVHTDGDDLPDENGREIKRAQVWELWDKDEKKVVAVVEGYDKLLMDEDDPLKLKDFFPQPEPAMMIETADSLIPIPEYKMYQSQAEELNRITTRIMKLTDSMKAVGFFPGEDAAKINEMLKGDNVLVPVDQWAVYAEKGGLQGMIDWMPIKEIADVWQRLVVQRDSLVKSIFELVGISDIQRGMSDPRETRGAQELKANFGSRRLQPKQQRVQRFFRDILRIKAELIAENFSEKTLSAMTGTPVTPEMLAIMHSDALRSFTIDVETDSTVMVDEQEEKQGVAEFMNAMSNYLAQVGPIVQSQPAAVEPLGKILLWMSRKFKIARDVEQEMEDFIKSFQAQAESQNGKADAEAQAAQAEMQMKQQQAQADQQMKMQAAQAEQQRKSQEAQAEQQRKDAETQADIARKDAIAQAEIARKNSLLAAEMRQMGLKEQEIEKKIETIERKAKIESGESDNVEPIDRSIRLVKDDDGQTVRVEVVSGDDVEGIDVERVNGT